MLDTITATYRSWAFRVTIWLLLAGIMGGLTVMVWVASEVKPNKTVGYKRQNVDERIDPLILLANQKPEETRNLVQPIKFDTVIRDKRNYPKEFKDLKFIKENINKWTLQVMNVAEHAVITDYLNNRADRDKFNYFRIVDKDNQYKYILTYGTFLSTVEAETARKQIDFKLPDSVEVFPETFKAYENLLDDYEVTPPVQDMATKRDVKLQGTSQEVPAKPKPKPQQPPTQLNEKKPTSIERPIEQSKNREDTLNVQETRSRSGNSSNDALASKRSDKASDWKNYDESKRQDVSINRQDNHGQNKPLKIEKNPPPIIIEEKSRPLEQSNKAEKNNHNEQNHHSEQSKPQKSTTVEREKEAKQAFPELGN